MVYSPLAIVHAAVAADCAPVRPGVAARSTIKRTDVERDIRVPPEVVGVTTETVGSRAGWGIASGVPGRRTVGQADRRTVAGSELAHVILSEGKDLVAIGPVCCSKRQENQRRDGRMV